MEPEFSFEWDPQKAALNLLKHGVAFTEAASAFTDEAGLLLDDPAHSVGEPRFILLGRSEGGRLLVVVHCLRAEGRVIRLISARSANRRERRVYTERTPS